MIALIAFKCQYLQKCFFSNINLAFSPDHHYAKIIVVASFVKYLGIVKVCKFAPFYFDDRAENQTI